MPVNRHYNIWKDPSYLICKKEGKWGLSIYYGITKALAIEDAYCNEDYEQVLIVLKQIHKITKKKKFPLQDIKNFLESI